MKRRENEEEYGQMKCSLGHMGEKGVHQGLFTIQPSGYGQGDMTGTRVMIGGGFSVTEDWSWLGEPTLSSQNHRQDQVSALGAARGKRHTRGLGAHKTQKVTREFRHLVLQVVYSPNRSDLLVQL